MADQVIDKDNLDRLTDAELFKACKRHGMNPGPITATTRSIYEKRLKKLLDGQPSGSKSTAAADSSVLDETALQQQREAEHLAKIKLEQARLAKLAAERELQVQRELEYQREQERIRELEREREKAAEREREREREREL